MAAAAVGAAIAAVVVTLRADFLAHSGWLAFQKADVILGPVCVGLYWRRRRPTSRFGPMLIAFGLVGVPYILQSSGTPVLFSSGVLWEGAIYLATAALILAFPSGRWDGLAERLILAVGTIAVVVPLTASVLVSPRIEATGSISTCSVDCPANALLVTSDASLAQQLVDVARAGVVAVAVATAGLLIWRFVIGTPPRRRALAVGVPIALVFLLAQAGYQSMQLLNVGGDPPTAFRWTLVGTRAAIWYGFLFALIAAQLFAGRVLRRVVEQSLRRPSLRELEAMLREQLGDPALRLGFWQPQTRTYLDADGVVLSQSPSSTNITVTEVERNRHSAAVLHHDVQLGDDPELLQAAAGAALLAYENVELGAAWKESNARIVSAGAAERRKLEQDLHDGAQQRLLVLAIRLGLTRERAATTPALQSDLRALEAELGEAIHELQKIAHGIYPSTLAESGILTALRSAVRRMDGSVTLAGSTLSRYPPEIETAIYYTCLEALQNATKHAGRSARISIRLYDGGNELRVIVEDNGLGFDTSSTNGSFGIGSMQDRLSALGGRLDVRSSRGHGTIVSGAVPL